MAHAMLTARLSSSLQLSADLAAALDATTLEKHNGAARSNTIAQQLWCVVGARESYARAIAHSAWQGFRCSLSKEDLRQVEPIRAALARSQQQVLAALEGAPWSEPQLGFVVDLLEHEAQHHGQLIRYFYANEIPFPAAFAARYALK